MIISRNNLRNFYVKQNKHFADLQYTFSYNNKWNKNVRIIKILSNLKGEIVVRFRKLEHFSNFYLFNLYTNVKQTLTLY